MKSDFCLPGRLLWPYSRFSAAPALPGAAYADPYRGRAITFDLDIAQPAELNTVRVTNTDVYRNKLPLFHDRADRVSNFYSLEVTDIREAGPAYNASLSTMWTTSDAPHETMVFAE